MTALKVLLAVVFSFQLSTYVFVQSDVVDDAAKSLELLFYQLVDATTVVAEAPNLWNEYISDISTLFINNMQADVDNFRFISNNISTIALNVATGVDCIEMLIFSPEGFNTDRFLSEELTFANLLTLAQADVSNVADQHFNLNNEFITNCLQNNENCEGTSSAVVAEVERLLPKVKRIALELLTEIYVLYYTLEIDLENAHADLMKIYNNAVQNATLCVASKIREQRQEPGLPIVPSESVSDLFEDLIATTESAAAASVIDLLSREDQVTRQNINDYLDYMDRVSTGISRANNTINSLIEVAQEYNVTLNCTILDVFPMANPSFQRIVSEFSLIVFAVLARDHTKAIKDINDIGRGIQSISLQIEDCEADASCDYAAEKIVLKQAEIPWQFQKVTNSTIVVLQQTVMAVRESAARVVRDTLEQLEVGLIDLKSCIQSAL